jgi:5'-deoxy-5'-methylthioadenosine phosphorylase
MTVNIGIIGGTGLTSLKGLDISSEERVETPFGAPSAKLVTGHYFGHQVLFLPRHGSAHTIPPHNINYRANIWALKQAGVTDILAVNAVGGIASSLIPGSLMIPDQLIDYTWGREHTFNEHGSENTLHIDFTEPYCSSLRNKIIEAAFNVKIDVIHGGVYAATQGPRLETAAEINRLDNDGCDIVGMTGMPEAALAKELKLCYACVALVVNAAAGRGEGEITMQEIETHTSNGMSDVRRILEQIIRRL